MYPTYIEAKIEDIEYNILSIESLDYHAREFKHLSFLPDNTPFAMVEVDGKSFVKTKVIK